MKTTTVIVGKCGYVESSYCSWLIFQSSSDHESRHAAVRSLAQQLFDYYNDQHKRTLRKCCKQYKDNKYCPDCGSRIKSQINFDDFKSWITGLHSATADDIGPIDEFGPWVPWISFSELQETPKEEILYISERFAEFMLYALDETKFDDEDVEALRNETGSYRWSYGKPISFNEFIEEARFDTTGSGGCG